MLVRGLLRVSFIIVSRIDNGMIFVLELDKCTQMQEYGCEEELYIGAA